MSRDKKHRKTERKLNLESLETRRVFASITSCGSTLSIYGTDDMHDSATVEVSNNRVSVVVNSVPRRGFALTPFVKRRTCSTSTVDKIRFYGRDGNDRFVNNWSSVDTYASGGNGNDYLEGYNGEDTMYGGNGNDEIKGYGDDDKLVGGSGNDTIDGGSGNDSIYGGSNNDTLKGGSGNDLIHGYTGNDRIYGGSGHDDLYGDAGRDYLSGSSGMDGLYGGAGTDTLYGGSGADRFLVMEGHAEYRDLRSWDAVIKFRNGTKGWTEEEIEDVDVGLRLLHHKTGNDNLLEMKNGSSLTFQRDKAKGTAFASNNSAGRIRIYDKLFSEPKRIAATVVHEVGHNWDTEHSKWSSWQKLSGWTNRRPSSAQLSRYQKGRDTDETWYHLRTASFVSTYAKTNPREDFAESWESYFIYEEGMTSPGGVSRLSRAKLAHLDAFFASLS